MKYIMEGNEYVGLRCFGSRRKLREFELPRNCLVALNDKCKRKAFEGKCKRIPPKMLDYDVLGMAFIGNRYVIDLDFILPVDEFTARRSRIFTLEEELLMGLTIAAGYPEFKKQLEEEKRRKLYEQKKNRD